MKKKRNSRKRWEAKKKRIAATIDRGNKRKKLLQKAFAFTMLGLIVGSIIAAFFAFIL